jgi:hypothetical protein
MHSLLIKMAIKTLSLLTRFICAFYSTIDMIICGITVVNTLSMTFLTTGVLVCVSMYVIFRREIVTCRAVQAWSILFPSYRAVFLLTIAMAVETITGLCGRIIQRRIAVDPSGIRIPLDKDNRCHHRYRQDDQPHGTSFFLSITFQFFLSNPKYI